MKATARKIDPEEFILAVLSPKERFEAGMRVAREAFQNTTLTIEDIEATIYSALGIDWTTVRRDDPLKRGFEYVPFNAEYNFKPVDELWG